MHELGYHLEQATSFCVGLGVEHQFFKTAEVRTVVNHFVILLKRRTLDVGSPEKIQTLTDVQLLQLAFSYLVNFCLIMDDTVHLLMNTSRQAGLSSCRIVSKDITNRLLAALIVCEIP